jgi:hypothetical protein
MISMITAKSKRMDTRMMRERLESLRDCGTLGNAEEEFG